MPLNHQHKCSGGAPTSFSHLRIGQAVACNDQLRADNEQSASLCVYKRCYTLSKFDGQVQIEQTLLQQM